MKYLAVLGRLQALSLAEIRAQFGDGRILKPGLAVFESAETPQIDRLGGSLKLAEQLSGTPLEYLTALPEGKITLGVSDYSKTASAKRAGREALKLKQILKRHGRSVRILENKDSVLSTATCYHNKLGLKEKHEELILVDGVWYRSIGVQNIEAYRRRDQERPFRDAKVGMLPPKLAQILINLCGVLPTEARVLDPFCGTGVLVQEAVLLGYFGYGTDVSERMVEYSQKNLATLRVDGKQAFLVEQADATAAKWRQLIGAVACETYLGPPMSEPPTKMRLLEAQQECRAIISGFLQNIAGQLASGTPVTIAVPAWRIEFEVENGVKLGQDTYARLFNLDEIEKMGYNRDKELSRDILMYYREGQVVAREIIVLRKK